MKIRNLQHRQVEIAPATDHPVVLVEPGEAIEVADDLGAALLEQPDNWQKVDEAPPVSVNPDAAPMPANPVDVPADPAANTEV